MHGRWVNVDSAKRGMGLFYMYEKDWKKDLKLMCAFEDAKIEDATVKYKIGK